MEGERVKRKQRGRGKEEKKRLQCLELKVRWGEEKKMESIKREEVVIKENKNGEGGN
jgi:hypothetical protein